MFRLFRRNRRPSATTPIVPDVNGLLFSICSGGDDVEALRELAEKVGVDTLLTARRPNRTTALHVACESSNQEIAAQLIEWGADVSAKSMYNSTPLHGVKQPSTVELLVKKGAEVNITNDMGCSPLCYTIDVIDSMEALLRAGALVKFGVISALENACSNGRKEAVKVLLKRRGFLRVLQWKGRSTETVRETAERNDEYGLLELLDAALPLAQRWDRRVSGSRVGLAAADSRVKGRQGRVMDPN